MRNIHWEYIFGRVVLFYLSGLIIVANYYASKFLATFSCRNLTIPAPRWRQAGIFLIGVFIIFCISFLLTVKGPSEDEDPSDYHEMTTNQQYNFGTKVFLCLLPATLFGVSAGFREDKRLKPDERKKRNEDLNRPGDSNDDW
jgi:hypothetical protein